MVFCPSRLYTFFFSLHCCIFPGVIIVFWDPLTFNQSIRFIYTQIILITNRRVQGKLTPLREPIDLFVFVLKDFDLFRVVAFNPRRFRDIHYICEKVPKEVGN